ncbi:hypothetical protein [Teredinibacter waterburyi]|uniref:hypothetical protein n=1 Tax=Teredinibacter waterburyi TaxID=1500538 RepID=UPI00165FF167|nr:hypothetical protein [Teredinibacter waterburyi]
MKFIANTFFLALIWKRYSRLIVAVALLFASYFMVATLHSDYLDYVKNSGVDRYLALSYVVKWVLLIALTAIFYFVVARTRSKVEVEKRAKMAGRDTFQSRRANEVPSAAAKTDPFESIRHKRKLRGRADQFLDEDD